MPFSPNKFRKISNYVYLELYYLYSELKSRLVNTLWKCSCIRSKMHLPKRFQPIVTYWLSRNKRKEFPQNGLNCKITGGTHSMMALQNYRLCSVLCSPCFCTSLPELDTANNYGLNFTKKCINISSWSRVSPMLC